MADSRSATISLWRKLTSHQVVYVGRDPKKHKEMRFFIGNQHKCINDYVDANENQVSLGCGATKDCVQKSSGDMILQLSTNILKDYYWRCYYLLLQIWFLCWPNTLLHSFPRTYYTKKPWALAHGKCWWDTNDAISPDFLHK